ncbi:hypothetical protein ABPG72_016196 [Tetrahymena utriculariae]
MEIEDYDQNEINQSQFCIENLENNIQSNSMKDQSQFLDNYDQNCYYSNQDEIDYHNVKQNIEQINHGNAISQNTIQLRVLLIIASSHTKEKKAQGSQFYQYLLKYQFQQLNKTLFWFINRQ